MDPVKKERVSPLLGEGGGSYDPSTRTCITSVAASSAQNTLDLKPNIKVYHPQQPVPQQQPPPQPPQPQPPQTTAHSSPPLPTVITSVPSSTGGGAGRIVEELNGVGVSVGPDGELLPGHSTVNFSGEISDAVTKILEDYDWSKIPLANNERRKVHVKRPMNAFMVWAQEARRKLSCTNRQVHNAELSKSLGRIWRGMTEDQKRPFMERADHLRRKHKQEYPDYKYQPRRRKENVKTVGKPNHVSLQDLPPPHHYVSSAKGGTFGVGLHPLSPPHSPSGPGGAGRGHPEGHVPDTAFVSDCLADSLESIDRAEMNKYLLPDQGTPTPYGATPSHGSLHPMTTMTTTMATMNTITTMNPMNPMTTTGGGSPCTATAASLTSLPPIGSRLLPPAPVYGGPGSPYYTGGTSPQPAGHGSPDLPTELGTSGGGGVSPGGSPGSPSQEYVELQPPRPLKEEPLPSLTMPKANVSPFLPQNLCYSTQPYAFQYSYPYAPMWH
ncbi:transcription factor SOX-8-like isoform X2 [Eriocheir sinensis]|uniref:transcription factor SOX-8-like isoform X2 n=1 Tax=Eriocheir sinensis TaxID=95602 RepID=UPI0021C7ED3E|nr:transcription factor SOX-8-like isoform X2 [Eriocheir sinensis]